MLPAIDGLGWMAYVSPPLGTHLFPSIAAVSGLAELPLQLWPIVVGLNPARWKERASAASTGA
jgi:hypothetical protein